MGKRFTMTYEVITPESSEHGDVAEHGFYEPGGWQYPMPDDPYAETPEPAYLGLRECLDDVGGLEPNDSRYQDASWWSEIDGNIDYSTGAQTIKAVHLPRNITPSSRRRINRLIRGR